MSGLEALSLVCSIMQVISFTKEVLTVCKDVYEGRTTADSQMGKDAASIKELLEEMNRTAGSSPQQTKEENELHAIAQKCSKAAEELENGILRVTNNQKPGSPMGAVSAGIRSFFGKRKITSLYDQFCKHQKTLETHILVRLCTKSEAVMLQERDEFHQLSETMKHFVSQMAAGHTDMASLVTRDGTQTRQQIQQSEDRLKQEINDVHTEAISEAKRERLLCSLKYESMNSRRTGLKPAHEATYLSIFDSLGAVAPDAEGSDAEGSDAEGSGVQGSNEEPYGEEFDEEPFKEFHEKPFVDGKAARAWEKFIAWLQSEKQVFWIQGKPGSGKSTLMKFILQHEKTQMAVDRWRPSTLLVSHFFWKPGNLLQKNLRGLLCSLNHQLLSSDHTLVGHVLSEHSFARGKDTIGDWEIAQLDSLFFKLLGQCKRSVFFLIDGLDEATSIDEVLRFLESLTSQKNVKLCISSRSENVFHQMFFDYDGFKLEDLTWGDMSQFALAGIPDSCGKYPAHFLKELRRLLVCKAEGVFLWLVLALESVKRGLRNNDKEDEIHLRLEQLPSKLEELYADMWDRLGDDKAIYQREAARYFALLVANQALLDAYQQRLDHIPRISHLNPFLLMLDKSETLRGEMLKKSYEPSVSEIEKECADVAFGIPIKTAGFLVNVPGYGSFMEPRPEYRPLRKHLSLSIEFLHRTLLDFFLESEVGTTILAQSQTGCIKFELAAIFVCQLRTLNCSSRFEGYWRMGAGGALSYCMWILSQSLAQGSASERAMVVDLLHDLESLFEAGLIPWDNRPYWYPKPPFDLLLFVDPAYKPLLRLRIESRGSSHATIVLREAMRGYVLDNWAPMVETSDSLFLKDCLMTLGGDIKSTDICLYDTHYDPKHLPNGIDHFTPYESILSAAIRKCLKSAVRSEYRAIINPMRLLSAALERAPDLNKRTSFALSVIQTGQRPHVNLPLVDQIVFEYMYAGIGENGNSPWEHYTIVISEVNLRYLIEIWIKAIPSGWKNTAPEVIRVQNILEAEDTKPYIRPRFLTQEGRSTRLIRASKRCYQFIDQDLDIMADSTITKATANGFAKYDITPKKLAGYRSRCEEVPLSALAVLADERLGVCRLAEMGIKPPG
ncbi:hypothetical protein V8C44DRAFT_334400 [Trichoderma aethiopicum]